MSRDNSNAGQRLRTSESFANTLPVFQFTQLGSAANVTCNNAVSWPPTSTTVVDGTVIPCKKLAFSRNDGGVKTPVVLSGDLSNDGGPGLRAGVYEVHFSCRVNQNSGSNGRVQLWLDANGTDPVLVAESRSILATAVTAEPLEINTVVSINLDDVTRNKLEAYYTCDTVNDANYVSSDYKLTVVCLSRRSRLN